MKNYLTGRGKNALKFVSKAISLIELQQQLIQWKIQTEEQSFIKKEFTRKDLEWTGTVADLVELAYATLETKKINYGDLDINVLIEKLCNIFSFEVKDCYDTFRAIRRRVGSRTLFLDEMKEKLNERMDDMDNGIFKKKKVRK